MSQYVKPVFPGSGKGLFPSCAGVLARIDADALPEHAGEVIGVCKAAGVRDELNGVLSLSEQEPGIFDADLVEVFSRRDAGILAKAARQVFLAHLERTRILIHVVDAAGTEGRDPIEDMMAINRELARYRIDLSSRKQIVAANKCDLIMKEDGGADPGADPIKEIRAYCEPLGIEVFPISAATGQGVRELLYHVSTVLSQMPGQTVTYEQEYDPEIELAEEEAPFTVFYDSKSKEYKVEGPRIERMLGYTNLETEKGFQFFQKFLVDNGIIDELRRQGCKEGDFVRLYGHGFEFYD